MEAETERHRAGVKRPVEGLELAALRSGPERQRAEVTERAAVSGCRSHRLYAG